eukprot:3273167-Rhodomonas_salina.1
MSCTKCQTPKILRSIVKATENEDWSGFNIKNTRDFQRPGEHPRFSEVEAGIRALEESGQIIHGVTI